MSTSTRGTGTVVGGAKVVGGDSVVGTVAGGGSVTTGAASGTVDAVDAGAVDVVPPARSSVVASCPHAARRIDATSTRGAAARGRRPPFMRTQRR